MCATREEALAIGHTLVEERLAAAANVLGEAVSVYRWEGRIHEKPEAPLLLKTRADLASRLVARVKELHGYECPSVIVVPITAGNRATWSGLAPRRWTATFNCSRLFRSSLIG
jgi:periplasmic divalent cation tolerance protein